MKELLQLVDIRESCHEILRSGYSGDVWVMGARGGLQFCRPPNLKSWDACMLVSPHFWRYHSHFAAPSSLPPGAVRIGAGTIFRLGEQQLVKKQSRKSNSKY